MAIRENVYHVFQIRLIWNFRGRAPMGTFVSTQPNAQQTYINLTKVEYLLVSEWAKNFAT